jgi:SecD/SecF fusion protein
MQSKGTLGSIIAGVIAVFLVLVCLFYLSFSLVTSHYENEAEQWAAAQVGPDKVNSDEFNKAKKRFLDHNNQEEVWMGYTLNEVQKWGVGLGLDLKGGMSVTLQVSMPDLLLSMKNGDQDEQFTQALAETDSIINSHVSDDYVGTFVKQYRALRPQADLSVVFNGNIKAGATDEQAIATLKNEVKDRVNNSATNVLRNRIDAYGVVSPNIQVLQGKDGQILLELPGVKEPDRVAELLQRSANLEFFASYKEDFSQVSAALNQLEQSLQKDGKSLYNKAVSLAYGRDKRGASTGEIVGVQPGIQISNPIIGYYNVNDTAAVNRILASADAKRLLPGNIALRWDHSPETFEKQNYLALYALKSNNGAPAMDGSHITNARADYDSNGKGNVVSMEMDNEGAKNWSRLTGQQVGYPVAIVLDGQVYSAPNVNTQINGGRSEITGRFDVQEAQDLANVLKSGKMTAKVNIISQMVIGPSLGQASIDAGVTSFIVALILLMILMIAYYGIIPGLVANFGLICNLFFTFGILASFQAVLTMSGIAGIVLALGMAVDANVLIFERAKEELRAGKNARTAIADGYSNAFSAIFDSNLTSIITGVILLAYGTGPIKGFATTLIIGIICSFFTAVYLTRIVFILGAKKKAFERITFTTKLSRKVFVDAKVNFLGKRKITFAIAGAFIAIVVVSLCTRGLNQGIDFSGGRNYVVKFDTPQTATDVEAKLKARFEGASVSVITIDSSDKLRVSTNYKLNPAEGESRDEFETKAENEIIDILFEELSPLYKNGISIDQFKTTDETIGIISSQRVGATVANDMRKAAVVAVILSLIAMFLYILIRFRNIAFSFGALAAVAFTAFSIIGIYSLCYGIFPFAMEIDQNFIAAILTIIGYQINDTVVVFDRVRENTSLFPKQDFFTNINRSINSTLGRTIMTSGSTLLVLLSIFFLGGDSIRSFIFAMIFGVVVGTLATMFIAAPVAYLVDHAKKGKKAQA